MEYVGRQEYEEHNQRMEDEHKRIHRRLEIVEDDAKQTGAIVASIEKMAINMEHMADEQKKQGIRLEALERVPLETNKQVRITAITALVSGIVGAVLAAFMSLL